ncbi:MAG: hypothetical protein ACLUKN_16410 [Bacilli bacterium]
MVSLNRWKREHSIPVGIPMQRPIAYPRRSLFIVTHIAPGKVPSIVAFQIYAKTSEGGGNINSKRPKYLTTTSQTAIKLKNATAEKIHLL